MARPVKHGNKWRIRWLDADGKRRSECYSRRKDAEFRLAQHQSQAEAERRGLARRASASKTMSQICDYWLAHRAPKKRSCRDDQYMIEAALRPFFGSMLLQDISQQQVDQYVASREDLSPKTVSNHLTLLVAMLNQAEDLRWITNAPRIRKPKPTPVETYRYLKTSEEIERFLGGALTLGENVHALYATAIYTGMRAGELGGLCWDDVDFSKRLITVQRSFEGPTKTGRIRHLPILDPVLPVLRRAFARRVNQIVFPNSRSGPLRSGYRVFEDTLRETLDISEFEPIEQNGRTQPYITFHCLRHTFASHWVMNGGDIFKLQRILGHQAIQMTMRYAHLAPEAFKSEHSRLGSSLPNSS